MVKAAIVVLADSETHGDLARVTNALETAQQFKDRGHEVRVVFDGAGTTWVPKITDKEHDLNPMFEAVQDTMHGACQFCANAFGVRQAVEDSPVPVLAEHNRHPDLARLVEDGFQVITF